MLRRAVLVAAATVLLAAPSRATVYAWRDAAGVYHYTNRADEVPSGPLDAYRSFEDVVVSPAANDTPDVIPPDPPDVVVQKAYADGIEEGRRIAEEHAEREREVAALDAPPAAQPFVIDVPAPPPVYVSVVPADAGAYGVADPCAYGNCWPVYGGPLIYGGPFFGPLIGHGRFGHGRHGHHARFAGRGGMVGPMRGPMRGPGGRGGFGLGR